MADRLNKDGQHITSALDHIYIWQNEMTRKRKLFDQYTVQYKIKKNMCDDCHRQFQIKAILSLFIIKVF